jgi:ABC-type transport system involved in multi-copper enzyme maturation permease subunit
MRREWRMTLWAALSVAFVIELLLVPAVLFWPKFEENLPMLRAIAPIKMLKEQIGHIEETGAIGYVLAQHYFKVCSTLGTLAAVLFASPAVAGHAMRGTLELCLARPISRKRMLTERFALGALALALAVFATSATIPPLAARVDETIEQVPLLWCSLHQTIFLVAIYSATFLASTLSSSPWVVAGAMLFASLLHFALYMIDTATHWSLFRLSDVPRYLAVYEHRALDWRIAGPMLAVIAVCFALSLVAFERRSP